jgi:hypothetical protein
MSGTRSPGSIASRSKTTPPRSGLLNAAKKYRIVPVGFVTG